MSAMGLLDKVKGIFKKTSNSAARERILVRYIAWLGGNESKVYKSLDEALSKGGQLNEMEFEIAHMTKKYSGYLLVNQKYEFYYSAGRRAEAKKQEGTLYGLIRMKKVERS